MIDDAWLEHEESKLEEVLMGGRNGEEDEVGKSIAYVIERHLFHVKEVAHQRVIKMSLMCKALSEVGSLNAKTGTK